MVIETTKIEEIRSEVINLCKEQTFVHSTWYVKYHLEIVEAISMELCQIYKDANREWVKLLVWMHDFEKIVSNGSIYKGTSGKKFLIHHEFPDDAISKILSDIEIFNRKEPKEIKKSSIEIQIVSSADGASHMVGPFYNIYWWENFEKPIEEIIANNLIKISQDWENKIVLPEVKAAFQESFNNLQNSFHNKIPFTLLKKTEI